MSSSIQWNQLITLEEHNKNYEPNGSLFGFKLYRSFEMRQCHYAATRDIHAPRISPNPHLSSDLRRCVGDESSAREGEGGGGVWGRGGGDKRGVGGYAAAAELARCSSVRDGATHFQVYGKYVYADGGLRARARLQRVLRSGVPHAR